MGNKISDGIQGRNIGAEQGASGTAVGNKKKAGGAGQGAEKKAVDAVLGAEDGAEKIAVGAAGSKGAAKGVEKNAAGGKGAADTAVGNKKKDGGTGQGAADTAAGGKGKAGDCGRYALLTWPGREGIVYREYPDKRDGRKPDRRIYCRYRCGDKKRVVEPCGLLSELRTSTKGNPIDELYKDLLEVKHNIRRGVGPTSIKTLWESRKDDSFEARQKEKELRAERVRGEITLGEVAKLFMQWVTDNRKDHQSHNGLIVNHILPEFADKAFSSMTAQDLATFKAKLFKKKNNLGHGRKPGTQSRAKRPNSPLSPQTVMQILKAVREMYNFAAEVDHPDHPGQKLFTGQNPARLTKRSRVLRPPVFNNRRLRIPTDKELGELFGHVGAPQHAHHALEFKKICLLALDCGPREGEICFLRKEHFNPQTGAISFVKGSADHDTTKGGDDRTVFAGMLRPECLDMLRQQVTLHPHSPYLFPGLSGHRAPSSLGQAFARLADKYKWNEGITDSKFILVFHSLRHRFATEYLETYGDIYALKTLLGHSDIKTTEIYLHLCDPVKYAAAKARNEELRRRLRDGQTAKAGPLMAFG